MSSVYVVCWIFLQTFQTYFCIQANSVDPDQTAPKGAVWSGSTLFAEVTFNVTSRRQKQTTKVVIGALRVNFLTCHNLIFVKFPPNFLISKNCFDLVYESVKTHFIQTISSSTLKVCASGDMQSCCHMKSLSTHHICFCEEIRKLPYSI